MKFKIVDIVSKKVYGETDEKWKADQLFVEIQEKYPKRKLWLKTVLK